MNLNSLKRGFKKTNPEKGLRSLPGALKHDPHHSEQEGTRTNGIYVSEDHRQAGYYISISVFSCFLLSILFLLSGIFIHYFDLFPESDFASTLITLFFIFAFALHFLYIFADGLSEGSAPLARKGITFFWKSLALLCSIFVIYSWLSKR